MAYEPTFMGGVNIAWSQGALPEGLIITAPDSNRSPEVKVFNFSDASLVKDFLAYDPSFTGGVRLGVLAEVYPLRWDIMTTTGAGGNSHVQILAPDSLAVLDNFYAYDASFTGGVFVGGPAL